MKLNCLLVLPLFFVAARSLVAQINNEAPGVGETPYLQAASSIATGAQTVVDDPSSNLRYSTTSILYAEATVKCARVSGSFSMCDPTFLTPAPYFEGAANGSNVSPHGSEGLAARLMDTNTVETLSRAFDTAINSPSDTDASKCYVVGDCLFGAPRYMKSSGAFGDEADEGAYPIDVDVSQLSAASCSEGYVSVETFGVNEDVAAGTQGERDLLIDKRLAWDTTPGSLTRPVLGVPYQAATCSGTPATQTVFIAETPVSGSQLSSTKPDMLKSPIVISGTSAAFTTYKSTALWSTNAEGSGELPQAPSTEPVGLKDRRNEPDASTALRKGKQ